MGPLSRAGCVLFLTGTTQEQFIEEFNTLILEALVGTEVDSVALASAFTREKIVGSIRYRTKTGAQSPGPPSRVELLISLLSPWVNAMYRGCRYLQQAWLDMLRKYQGLHYHFYERREQSIFDRTIKQDKVEYVM